MFGRRGREHSGLSAEARAEVLGAEAARIAITLAPSPVVANTEQMWDLKLRVTPDGLEPFDVDVRQPLPQLEQPRVGQIVSVLYDPEDRSRVALNLGDAARGEAAAEAVASRLDPAQGATLEQFTGGSVQDLMKEALSDPQGFAARMRERAEAAQPAAMAHAEEAMTQAAAAAPTAQPGAPAGAVDPLDRLAKLADLRERGMLTNEEFEAQKKHILAE